MVVASAWPWSVSLVIGRGAVERCTLLAEFPLESPNVAGKGLRVDRE
jgi:hypothetical protein